MASLLRSCIRRSRRAPGQGLVAPLAVGLALLLPCLAVPARAADQPAMPLKAPAVLPSFDWTGFYVGGHFGYAGGTSNWTADTVAGPTPVAAGSLNLLQ